MVVSDGVAKNLVTTLDLGPPRVVLGEGLKDMHRQRYGGDLCERVCCGHTTTHRRSSWIVLEKKKFIDLKIHFRSL